MAENQTDAEKKAAAEAAAAEASKKKESVVQYSGQADVRRITKEEWEAIQVKDQDTVEWTSDNNFQVPLKDLNKDAQAYLEKDSGLSIVEA